MFLGKPGAGKTTAAGILVDGIGFIKLSLGRKLHEIADDLGLHRNRGFLQDLGQLARKYNPDAWINVVAREMREYEPGYHFVVDDVRQPNEFEFFVSQRFIPVRIVTDKEKRIKRLRRRDGEVDMARLEHPVESMLDGVKCGEIDNNGTLGELWDKVIDLIQCKGEINRESNTG